MSERETTIAISKVEKEIEEVAAQIKKVENQLEENGLPSDEKAYLLKKEEQLRTEKEQLRKEEELLRKEKILILQRQLQHEEDNILGEGVYEKLTGAVCFFREDEGKQYPIGAGFAISETIVYSVAHHFADPAVDKVVTCHFGKPNQQTTRRLKIVSFDVRLDYCILSIVAGEACLPEFLEISSETLKTGRECILAAFQIGLQQEIPYLDPEMSVGVFKGEISKLYPRHFVYQCPSFAGDSGGSVVLKSGKVIGLHQETVIQARQRIECGVDMDADARLQSVEASIDDLIRSLSSGSIGLQLSAIVRHDVAQGD